jgi:hypothetical protein
MWQRFHNVQYIQYTHFHITTPAPLAELPAFTPTPLLNYPPAKPRGGERIPRKQLLTGEIKVMMPLCLIKCHTLKTYGK